MLGSDVRNTFGFAVTFKFLIVSDAYSGKLDLKLRFVKSY